MFTLHRYDNDKDNRSNAIDIGSHGLYIFRPCRVTWDTLLTEYHRHLFRDFLEYESICQKLHLGISPEGYSGTYM